jgi:hypothetical protein
MAGGIGVVGHGVSEPSRQRKRPDLCAENGHPGATYNPYDDRTWCLCGAVIYDGNQHTHHACCGGPLVEYRSEKDRAYWEAHRA